MKRILCSAALLLLGLAQSAPAGADELRLYDEAKGQSAAYRLTYWRDAGAQAGIEGARAADRAGQFQPARGRTSFGIDTAPHWFRLDLRRPAEAPATWWIELAHPGLDDVQLYMPGPAGYIKRYEVGDHRPFADRPIVHRNFIFPVSLPAEQSVTLYFRVQTADTLMVPLRVWNPERFGAADSARNMLLGVYYGVILAMLVYNLFIYIRLRDRPYLYYLIFSLTMVAVIAEFNGQLFQHVFPNDLWWADRQHIVFPLLALGTTLVFARSFLDLKTALPWMDRVVWGAIVVEIMVCAIGMAFDYTLGQKMIVAISPFIMLVTLGAGVLRVRQGYRPAKYFVVAEIPLQVCVTYAALAASGLVSFELQMQQAIEIGAVLEVLLYSLALADRMAAIRLEKEAVEARLKVHEKLATLEQESRTILENTPDTVARYDRACRRTYVNPAFGAMADGGAAMLLGKTPSEYPGGPDAANYEAKVAEVFATGNNTHFELKWPGRDGRALCSHIRLTPERDLSGAVTSVLAVGRDITELNEYQAELQRKELAKTRFLAAAGHDLRQPLAAANLFIDALRMTEPTPRQQVILQRLDQSMSTFNGLLDALLNISKLDAGAIKPEYASIEVAEIFSWVEQNFAPVATAKHLRFRLYFPMRERLAIRSDLGLVKSVLMNLVSNAIHYTETGAILVSVRKRGAQAMFQVWDTGIGISEEHIRQVFDEFYQVNNPQRDRTRGLGLGLSIARRAMSLLGAEVTCRSQAGRGTVFGFSLPLEIRQGRAARLPAAAVPMELGQESAFVRGKRFAVVEDDALVAQAIAGLLEGLGGEVLRFHSAEDTLRHHTVEFADYFISDYMLAGPTNGIQLLNKLRQRRGQPINAVLITGDTSPAFLAETTDCAWTVLHKPINLYTLISSLRDSETKYE